MPSSLSPSDEEAILSEVEVRCYVVGDDSGMYSC